MGIFRVEGRGGFVAQQDLRLRDQRAGDAGTLLLPPESLAGQLSRRALRPTSARISSTRFCLSARGTPAIFSGSSTFCATVLVAIKLKC
jgi:hypothetical protein